MKDLIDKILGRRKVMSDKEIALELIKLYTHDARWPWSINKLQSVYIQLAKNIKTLTYEDIGEILDEHGDVKDFRIKH